MNNFKKFPADACNPSNLLMKALKVKDLKI